ncbi:uncharacterized protein LOC144769716 [Lissotriton helveticus]
MTDSFTLACILVASMALGKTLNCNSCTARSSTTCSGTSVMCSGASTACLTSSELSGQGGKVFTTFSRSCSIIPEDYCNQMFSASSHEEYIIRVHLECCNSTDNCNRGSYNSEYKLGA